LTKQDDVLLEQARQYNAQALAEIYDQYAESIYRYLYRYLGDAILAEDLTSEVFIKLLAVLDTKRAPRHHLQGWLYRVARNLAMDWFREQAKGQTLALDEELVDSGQSPPSAVEKKESHQQLRWAISQLTAGQQQVILLRFGEGLKLGEVARIMDKSEGAIKLLQYRATRRLRKLLAREETTVDVEEESRSVGRFPATSSPGNPD
jgi:RNA polymerase sigma-70 factor (ECF subfamily)